MIDREYQYLVDFAKQEGYTQDKLDFFQSAIELKNFNLLQKGVSRLILNSSNLTSVVKSFNSWREFTDLRKRIKKFAQVANNYMKKPDMMSCFAIWRNIAAKEVEEERTLPKKQLIARVAKQRNNLFFITNQVNSLQKQINETEQKVFYMAGRRVYFISFQ